MKVAYNSKNIIRSLKDLTQFVVAQDDHNDSDWTVEGAEEEQLRTLTVVPSRRSRTYLEEKDVYYDWIAGRDFTVSDPSSPLSGDYISCLNERDLYKRGYDRLLIRFNNRLESTVEVVLTGYKGGR